MDLQSSSLDSCIPLLKTPYILFLMGLSSDGNISLEVVKEVENRQWLNDDQFYFYLEPIKGVFLLVFNGLGCPA